MVNFIVERKVQNGDIVLVNRQPTLYKYGMIGNIVKKVPRKNIGMHMCETKMRNADFDGDEANIHVMQVLDARVEAMTFANVMDAIPDGLKNRVMIGMFFNALSSAYIMTREPVTNPEIIAKFGNYPLHEVETMKTEVILTKAQIEEAHSILSYKEDLPTLDKRLKKHGINPLSGKALFSCILPYNFNYIYEPDDKGNDEVIIKDGVLIKGRINNKHIGQGGGKSMQMSIWKWYGRDRAVSFITDCVFVTDWFIYQYGLTLGFDDIYLTDKIRNEIDNIKRKNITELKIKIAELGRYEDDMTAVAAESREKNISLYLGDCSNGINKSVTAALSPENPLNIMAKSGAKGKDLNTAQITGMKGQEFVFKKRPEMKISDETRCLPYFEYTSQDIKARGFISHSFLEGMTPSEMYFMSEGAREGSISTATRTADSGDLSHKINKVLEDFKVCYDGSVRNASDVIFQFGYFDGYDGSEIINTSSKSTGPVLSFMNLKEAVAKINNEF
jgi:DNA-directed RNA polymerase beta' subunit